VLPDGALRESRDVLARHVDGERRQAAYAVVDHYCREIEAIELPGYPATDKDVHIKQAAADHDCDAICTYDTDDFLDSAVPPWSPRRLCKEVDFTRFAFEVPNVGSEGTYMLLTRTYGGDAGRLLRESETEIWFRPDGAIEAEGPGLREWQIHHRVPLGYAVAIVVRYNNERCEVAAWHLDRAFPAGVPSGSGGKPTLAEGRIEFTATPATGVIPYAEGFGSSSVPVWLREHSVRAGVADRSLEVAFGSRSVVGLLARLDIIVIAPGLADGFLISWH
jgi:hypothetical protein